MSDRDDILSNVSSSLGETSIVRKSRVQEHLSKNVRGVIPARGDVSGREDLVNLFIHEASLVNASCVRLSCIDDVPLAVVNYIGELELPSGYRVWLSEQSIISSLDWSCTDGEILSSNFVSSDLVLDNLIGVNVCRGGVAETGSLAFTSSSDLRLVQGFLSSYHVAILFIDDIFGCYEDFLKVLGLRFEGGRGLIFVTGPSRTGDIAQTLELGAHGALGLHVLLVDKKP